MLWIYLNNQGNVECQVNVGNLIRQGNKIPLFVVLDGQNTEPQSMIWRLADVGYLKPSAKEFIYVYDGNDPEETEKTFQLNNPSQANAHFISGKTYKGYEIWITSDATNFPANGGHVALSFLMKDLDNRGVFADTVAVYVEPTQGMHPITITAEDYATLIDLFKASNVFNLGEVEDLDFLDDYLVSQSLYFTIGGVPYFALISYDEETHETKQILIFVENQLLYAKERTYDGEEWSQWTEETLLDEITRIVITSGNGAAGTTDTYTIYTKANPQGIGTFTVYNGRDGVDGLTPYINPTNKHWMIGDVDTGIVAEGVDGVDGIDGDDAGFANPTATAEASSLPSGAPPTVIATVSASGPDTAKEFDFHFEFAIPRGADGVITEANGLIGFQINSSGHLIMTYSGGERPNVSINEQGHLIYTY